MGRECPHQNKGQSSCISGGRIDASCCVDSHISLNQGCRQRPWIDGVLCCKQSGKFSEIDVLHKTTSFSQRELFLAHELNVLYEEIPIKCTYLSKLFSTTCKQRQL